VKTLKELILETLETVLVDYCEGLGLGHERAFVLFVEATSHRQGILRKADDQDIPFVETICELVPEIVDSVERKLHACGSDEEAIVSASELSILALYTGAMEVLGDIQLMKEDSAEKGR
jgi:hypothetical protein